MRALQAGALLLSLVFSGCSQSGRAEGAAGGPPQGGGAPPVPVTLAKVSRKPMPLELSAIGTVEASSSVAIRAQITGELTSVNFKEGDDVEQGQVLFTLDRRPLERRVEAGRSRAGARSGAAGQCGRPGGALEGARRARHRDARAGRYDEHRRGRARGDGRRGSGGHRERLGPAPVRDDQGADLRPHRRVDGPSGQSRARQRSDAAGRDQSGRAGAGVVRHSRERSSRCSSSTWRRTRCGSRRVPRAIGSSRRSGGSRSSTTRSTRRPA